MRPKPREHVCPLLPESGQVADRLGMSALCQKRTYAPQQKAVLLDHLVGAKRHVDAEAEGRKLGTLS
jgi:hypothetical protein